MYIFKSREELLGIIIKGLTNANMGKFNTMAAVCEIEAVLKQNDREDYVQIYQEWFQSIDEEKNIFEKLFEKTEKLIYKRKNKKEQKK